ncbi:zona pellucida glycoprotein 2, like 1 isoform X2 [Megalobrama amblycephala]|uniref:zona pellucida glycoprotein 2, like 1 isoform X2 n=1 Tax=Megalobrama amblycephala TaxID=75352 RepID=UPI0020140046|nr:zona pellucida glycoprotein 2, like 1 isoform X2 [Megalobrama amblycephala]
MAKQMDCDFLVYENQMTSTYEVGIGPLDSITRDRHYDCPYQDDCYLTTLIPVDWSSGLQFPTHYKRSSFIAVHQFAPRLQTLVFRVATGIGELLGH